MHLYKIVGLTVASEILLPGAWPLEAGTPDVVIRQGAVAASLPGAHVTTRRWEADQTQLLLHAEGAGRFLISNGDTIIFETEPGVAPEACAIYLQGTGIGMLLNQRGAIVLHASAVAMGGVAMLFCARSGEGKSTLAATLSTRGHAMISDDVTRILFDASGRPFVSTDARQLKLTPETIASLDLADRQGPAVEGVAKAYVSPPTRWGGGELPLGGIYLLRSSPDAGVVITQLDMATAAHRLARQAHRPTMVRHTGLTERYFEANAKMLRHAPMFTLERQRDLSRVQETAAMLEKQWGLG